MKKFEWHETKNRRNKKKHDVKFVDAARVLDVPRVTRVDSRRDYNEVRYKTTGIVDGVMLTVIYTERSGRFRLISARCASRGERRDYHAQIY